MIKLKPRTRIILLSVISILIVITIVLGITYSFMQANIESSSVTDVSLSSCANITLTDTGESINLSNSYPMSKTRALETTPYTLTITSSCEDGSGYNLYLATLSTNTLSASSIHYIITEHGNQNIVVEGMLSDASDGISDFEDYDIDQLNNGINGTYGSVYRLYSSGIQYNTEVSYDLYLYIDESVTNETMGQTFVAGVAVKASDYDFATINGVSVTEATTDSITVSVNASNGTNNITNYYYSINNGEYVSSASNTYTFEGLDTGTMYDIKVYVVDTNGVQSNVYSLKESTSDAVYLADYIKGLYTSDGANDLYYHDGSGTYGAQEAGDNSYRFSGANPNNYVCFGSDAASCPSDNLYRIIGVFGNQVKLIRNTSVGTMDWRKASSSSNIVSLSNAIVDKTNGIIAAPAPLESNDWENSDIDSYLNNIFISTFNNKWSNLIYTNSWSVNGIDVINAVKEVYNNEIIQNNKLYKSKVGLMYLSDYGYAASPNYWITNLSGYKVAVDNNWMFTGTEEWTITRDNFNYGYSYGIGGGGGVSSWLVNYRISFGWTLNVRPSFYLNADVSYKSGEGTQNNPYRIA